MQLELIHVSKYSQAETYTQTTALVFVALCLNGLRYMNITPPGGGAAVRLDSETQPFLSLLPIGSRLDFQFDAGRENWVIITRIPEIDAVPGQCEFRHIPTEFRFSCIRRLHLEEAAQLRERFARVASLWQSATAVDALAAEWLTAGICGELFRKTPDGSPRTNLLASRLRDAINADRGFRKTLAELCREIGCSSVFLRNCFESAYQITPNEYRGKLRLGRIMELIDQNELSLKEIAEQAGMRNVTHLHKFVHDQCGISPGKLRKQRQGI